MPPPHRRGRGRGSRGRGRGRGRGQGIGMSPGPRRKEDDEFFDKIEEEEESNEKKTDDGDIPGSPPGTSSTVVMEDKPSSPSKENTSDPKDKSDLARSYDFAQDEESKARLREELDKIKEQEKRDSQNNIDKKSPNQNTRREMDEDRTKVVLTWVGRNGTVGIKNMKKSQKELMKAARSVLPSSGTAYVICEKYDTYQSGGLYPLFHVSEDSGLINKLLNTENSIDPDILGPDNTVDQGVFEEVACITPPMQGSGATQTVLAVSAFKSIDPCPNPKLIKEWKQWTGARAFLQDISMAGLECHKIRFFVKSTVSEEPDGFYYALTTEVGIREPRDEGTFVDTLQRFRVERWFGYNTIYKKQ